MPTKRPMTRDFVDHPICDFCSDTHVAWCHWAKPFTLYDFLTKTFINMSQDWAACQACHLDIMNGRWEQLLNRATTTLSSRDFLDFAARVHKGFRENRLPGKEERIE